MSNQPPQTAPGPWVRIYLQSAFEVGDKRHPQTIMKELGIKYKEAEPVSVADCWLFHGVDVATVSKDRPAYIEFFKDEKTYESSEP